MEQGFQPVDFPYHPPTGDGKCYFAATNSRSLAEEYNRYYKDGILEVTKCSNLRSVFQAIKKTVSRGRTSRIAYSSRFVFYLEPIC